MLGYLGMDSHSYDQHVCCSLCKPLRLLLIQAGYDTPEQPGKMEPPMERDEALCRRSFHFDPFLVLSAETPRSVSTPATEPPSIET